MGNYNNFKLVIYCTSDAVAKFTEESLEQQIAFFQKYVQPDKVYVEPYRDDILVPREQLQLVKKVFAKHGIEVAGGITTTISDMGEPKQRMFNTFCYTDEGMKARLKEVVEYIASEFDELIIDDFYFTNCTCDTCRAQKGDRSWAQFRLDLMAQISREIFIEPAKAVNPKCRVTVKFPNWVESFQECGYNPGVQKDIYDMVYTGTETRHALHTQQHLPRYLSYNLMRWMENLAPGKNGGGWLDPYGCYPLDTYLEQAYLTVLSQPREVMLFCWHSLVETVFMPPLGFQLKKLDKLMSQTGKCVGIPVYHPADSLGEDHLEEYMGMAGIPFESVASFPADAPSLFLTAAAACDPDIVDKLEAYVLKGGKAIVTNGFVAATLGRGLDRMTSMRIHGRRATLSRYMVEIPDSWMSNYPHAISSVTVPVLEYRNNATWTLAKGIAGEENFGLLLRDTYGKGQMLTVVVPDNFAEFKNYPVELLTRIRKEMAVMPVHLEGPANIGVFAYDNDVFALYPFVVDGAQPEQISIHVKGGASALVDIESGRKLAPLYTSAGESVFRTFSMPGHFVFYRVERDGAVVAEEEKQRTLSAPPA